MLQKLIYCQASIYCFYSNQQPHTKRGYVSSPFYSIFFVNLDITWIPLVCNFTHYFIICPSLSKFTRKIYRKDMERIHLQTTKRLGSLQTCGFANQVIDLKVDNLLNRSPRSQGLHGDDWADNELPDRLSALPGNFLPDEDSRRRFRPLSFWTPYPL